MVKHGEGSGFQKKPSGTQILSQFLHVGNLHKDMVSQLDHQIEAEVLHGANTFGAECAGENRQTQNCNVPLATKKDMGVSKNRGTPKWMVYNGKPS